MFADLAKRNMAMFEGAAQAFAGKAQARIEAEQQRGRAVKAELAALQAKVDRLSR